MKMAVSCGFARAPPPAAEGRRRALSLLEAARATIGACHFSPWDMICRRTFLQGQVMSKGGQEA